MSQTLIPATDRSVDVLLALGDQGKDQRSRLIAFCDWLDLTGRSWHTPDLNAYRDYLLDRKEPEPLKPNSVRAHLSTIRAQYRRMLADNGFIRMLYHQIGHEDLSPADRKALVDEFLRQLQNAVSPESGTVKVTRIQDAADADVLRLTNEQARELLRQPGRDTLRGLRDTTMIATLLCTGVREAELCNLKVADLRQTYDGRLALIVRRGKGAKQRAVLYGDMAGVLDLLDLWLQTAGIETGHVFRGFYKGNQHLRPGRLSERSVERMLQGYPLAAGYSVPPHALRRTYARECYLSGMPVEAIQQNMGHSNIKTTLAYIGNLGGEFRAPGDIYQFNEFLKE